jgi:hypothetical protein
MKLVDDSKRVFDYYQGQLISDKHSLVLAKIRKILNEWSIIVNSGKISKEQIIFLEDSMQHTNEKVWHEAGSRLIKCISLENSVKEVFNRLIVHKHSQVRFHVVTLAPGLEKSQQNEILKIAINDKSKRVRIKAADVILRLQDNKKLKLLTERLVTETDKSVKDAIKFTLDNFNRIRKKDDGSTVLEIELKTTYNNGEHT